MILALDVSSTAIGYATFDADGRRLDAGVLRPVKRSERDACRRAHSMADELRALLAEHAGAVGLAVVEEAPKFKARGDVAAQNRAYGLIVGALLLAGVDVRSVCPATWTRNRPKDERNAEVRRRHRIAPDVDPGGDACDAIGLGEWWFAVGRQREPRVGDEFERAKRRAPNSLQN